MSNKIDNYLKDIIIVAENLGVPTEDLTREEYNEYRPEGSISARSFYNLLKEEGYDNPGWLTAKLAATETIKDTSDFSVEFNTRPTKASINKKSLVDTENIFKAMEELAKEKGLPLRKESSNKKVPVSVHILVGDIHSGKAVKNIDTGEYTFNKEILIKSFDFWIEENIRICKEIKNLGEIVVCGLGDIVDGEGVYDGQTVNQDVTCVPDQVQLAAKYIWKLLVTLKNNFPKVDIRFEGTKGNHGTGDRIIDPASSWDVMVYNMLLFSRDISKKDIKINFSKGEYQNFESNGLRFHMRHKATNQSITASGSDKFSGWVIDHKCDVIYTAHFHASYIAEYRCRKIIRNGSFVGKDDLSERIAKGARPMQITIVYKDGKEYAIYEIEVRR